MFLSKYVCKNDNFYLGRASYSQHYFDTNLSHPVFKRILSANYMCAQDVHTTHIATNMENIKNNALLYIGTLLQQGLHLLQSMVETIIYLLFGSPFSTGTVDWGYTRLVLLEHLRELRLCITIRYPSKIFDY